MKLNLKKEVIIWIVLAIPIVYLILMWGKLPDKLPTHFDFHGNANQYGPKYLPAIITIGIYILMIIIPFIDPRKDNYKIFEPTYFKLRFIIIIMIGLINLITMINSIYNNINIGMIIPIFIFMLIVVFGNYMGNIRHNYFVGIKVPWTLNNEENWNKTHRLAGKLMVIGGIAGIACLLVFKKSNFVVPVILLSIIIIPIVYSYSLHVKMKAGAK
jgi:uncharacterized membrane protein